MDDGDFIYFFPNILTLTILIKLSSDSHSSLCPQELLNSYNSLITEQCCVSAMFSVALHGSVTW